MASIEPTHKRRRKGLFANDLRSLLFAFGDVDSPDQETVAALDDILQDFIIDLCYEASRVSRTAHRTKIKVDDFKFAIRKDPRKLARVEDLLMLQKVITDAKKIFDDKEGRALAKKNEKERERERERERKKERERENEKMMAAAAAAMANATAMANAAATAANAANAAAVGSLGGS